MPASRTLFAVPSLPTGERPVTAPKSIDVDHSSAPVLVRLEELLPADSPRLAGESDIGVAEIVPGDIVITRGTQAYARAGGRLASASAG